MAGRTLTPIGVVVKWILIPVALLTGGFCLLGPRVSGLLPSVAGGSPVQVTPVAETGSSRQAFAPPVVDVRSRKKLSAPDVQITSQRPKRRHRLHSVESTNENGREPVDNYVGSPDSGNSPERKSIGPGT